MKYSHRLQTLVIASCALVAGFFVLARPDVLAQAPSASAESGSAVDYRLSQPVREMPMFAADVPGGRSVNESIHWLTKPTAGGAVRPIPVGRRSTK